MSRIIIFTGKGGVGKTSTAAAHAVKAAKEGMKTLIVSTDMAHNLSDIFMKELEKEPKEVEKNLWALEIDPNYELQRYYGSISEAVKKMMSFKNSKDEEAFDDIVVFPGMEELFSLLKIKEIYDENIYDLIIVDCAPTGETLSLLRLPEILSWYMEKLFPIGRVAVKVLRPISKAAFKLELPNTTALNEIEKLYVKLGELEKLLKDREVCSLRLVTIPEKMVVDETKRNYMYLNLYNFNVDGLYINRILPQDIDNNFFDKWKEIQKEYVQTLEDTFSNMPIYKIRWYPVDINGVECLYKIVEDSLKDKNIFKVLKTTQSEVFEKLDDGYGLTIKVPFTEKQQLNLHEGDNELIIKIGNFKRNIPMPDVMRRYSVSKAKFDNGILTIYFNEESEVSE
ncbi:arsenic ABC transporter ATPase [Clostridium sp. DMHC 10]|uniref:ArsA family ATPase n=1 Tax=Clostridium sp. DMHC 10 TaxID=747377 RepID=UPI00069D965E|nr:ArsA family ATPase [Clostridium sp. DMHC 10]KOF58263.1 arsenic ABC transporter ATPase [Clostridium sp. DMHC 10]